MASRGCCLSARCDASAHSTGVSTLVVKTRAIPSAGRQAGQLAAGFGGAKRAVSRILDLIHKEFTLLMDAQLEYPTVSNKEDVSYFQLELGFVLKSHE